VERWLPAFTQPPMTLEIFVNLSAEAVVGIAAGHRIQLRVVRDEPLVKLFPFRATGAPPRSMSDAPGSVSVGLRSRLLPEDRRLDESHDLAEAPRIGCVERPVLPLELPGLLGGILRQRPLRLAKGLCESRAPLCSPPAGFAVPASGTGPTGGTAPRSVRAVRPGRFFFVSKLFRLEWGSCRKRGWRFKSGITVTSDMIVAYTH
jgi:hypothetical protein